MKKYIVLFICMGFCTVFFYSCEKYLDKAPEAGLTEQDVFTKYANFKSYLDGIYEMAPNYRTVNNRTWSIKNGFHIYFNCWDQKYTLESFTDATDVARSREGHTMKNGQMGALVRRFCYQTDPGIPILGAMFLVIRKSNKVLENINRLTDISQEEKDDFIAQAHFARAFAHFTLFRFWGPMPYLTKSLGPSDQWDIPRLSKHETLIRIAADFDTAVTFFAKANRMRRDNPIVGGAGHLNHPDMFKPNGVAAKAFKARTLLYAASPLNNEHGIQDWKDAAEANWEAIRVAEQFGYFLLSAADYKLNYINTLYSDEEIWANVALDQGYNVYQYKWLITGLFGSNKTENAGDCPTQNFIDKFETKWGDPLNTDADRQAAITVGHYLDQDPYKNRDPRFYIDIIYNQAPVTGYGTATLYYETVNGATKYGEFLDQVYAGTTKTGYYNIKQWGGESVKNNISVITTDPIIRLAELYLNYAEAANEAYGPNTPAPSATLTAIQAINKVRTRIGMPDVLPQFTGSTDAFRPRIKNERNIELSFEGFYYDDIRRWMDAPNTMTGPLMRMDIEKVPISATYPIGYKHTRLPMPSDRQCSWKDAMYYFPFLPEDMFKMRNFVPNEPW